MLELQPALIHPHFLATPYVRPTIKVVADNALNPLAKIAVLNFLSGLVAATLAKSTLPKWEIHSRICATDAHGYVWMERVFDESEEPAATDAEGMKILRDVCKTYELMALRRGSCLPHIEMAKGNL